MNRLTVTELAENTWQLNEAGGEVGVDAYLLCGSERAVLVDALQTVTGVGERIRELTELPVDLILTHGHFDHCGPAMEEIREAGGRAYLDHRDLPILERMLHTHYPPGYFEDAAELDKVDLGGRILEILPLPGHTPGSLAVLDRRNRMLFSGDGFGSGPFWMQLPGSLPLAEFHEVLDDLLRTVGEDGDMLVYPGHRCQSPGQLTLQYPRDILEATRLIVDGALVGEEREMELDGLFIQYREAVHKSATGYCYDPRRLR